MKLIYQGTALAAAILEGPDIARVADAVRFYNERVAWSSGDTERVEFERILAELQAPAPQ